MSAFLATIFLGGEWRSGVTTNEPKANQNIVIRNKVLRKNYLEEFFSHSPKFFCFPSIVVVVVVLIRNLKSAETQGHPTRNFEKQS